MQIRWRSGRGHALAVYGSAFMALLVYLAFRRGEFQAVHRFLMAVFAVAIGYFVVVKLVNVTRVSVRDGRLRVEHGPLPWRGAVELPVEEVRRLSLDRLTARLELRTASGQEITLLDDLLVEAVAEADPLIAEMLKGQPPKGDVEP